MGVILDVLSGYVFVVVGITGLYLFPLFHLLFRLFENYVNKFSHGLIVIRGPRVLEDLEDSDFSYPYYLISTIVVSFTGFIWLVAAIDDSSSSTSIYYKDFPLEVVGLFYHIGVFLSPFITTALIFIAFTFIFKTICKKIKNVTSCIENLKRNKGK